MPYTHCVVSATATDNSSRYFSGIAPSSRPTAVLKARNALNSSPAPRRRWAAYFLSLGSRLEGYRAVWGRLGFEDADFANGGSDRLVDAVIAWG
jgi:hypothetical protein